MTKNKHTHYKNKMNELCGCVGCQMDRNIDEKIYCKNTEVLRCKKQQDELDLFLEENKQKPMFYRMKDYIASFWWTPISKKLQKN